MFSRPIPRRASTHWFQTSPPTRKQLASLLELLGRLCRECRIPAERIRSHKEVDPETLCPGRRLPMDEIRALLARRLAE